MSASSWAPAGRVLIASLATLLLGALVASAQTPPLAEVARKEEERRKTTKPPTKVLTNKDLPKVASRPPDTTGQAPAAPSSEMPKLPGDTDSDKGDKEKADKAKPEGDQVEKNETWWRARITEPREQLRRDEVLVEALQSRINGLTTDFIGRDDPYQRARIAEDRQKAIAEQERLRAEVVDLKKKIADIEEEARRAGVPPGWLR
jgi:hypothetical protein